MIIEFNNVTKNYGNNTALDSVSLKINQGEIFGYLGPNGAGKTTTIRLLLGLIRPSNGEIKLWEKSIADEKYADAIRQKIGFSLDNPGHFIYSTAYRNLMYYARIYKLKNPHDRVTSLLKQFELWEHKNHRVETFSKGMKQKLSLARAFLNNPELLVMDEPTSSLDPNAQKDLKTLLKQYVAEQSTTVFFSSHNLAEVEELCTKVALLKNGKIVFCDDLAALKEKYKAPVVSVLPEDRNVLPQITDKLRELSYVADIEADRDRLLIKLQDKQSSKALMKYFVENEIVLKEFSEVTPSLNYIYDKEV